MFSNFYRYINSSPNKISLSLSFFFLSFAYIKIFTYLGLKRHSYNLQGIQLKIEDIGGWNWKIIYILGRNNLFKFFKIIWLCSWGNILLFTSFFFYCKKLFCFLLPMMKLIYNILREGKIWKMQSVLSWNNNFVFSLCKEINFVSNSL